MLSLSKNVNMRAICDLIAASLFLSDIAPSQRVNVFFSSFLLHTRLYIRLDIFVGCRLLHFLLTDALTHIIDLQH